MKEEGNGDPLYMLEMKMACVMYQSNGKVR